MAKLIINKNVALKLSLEWIKRSFITFREFPLQFICLGIVFFLIELVPFIGSFMAPLFSAQFMVLAEKIKKGEKLILADTFAGIFSRGSILRLAFINFCLITSIVILQYLCENIFFPDSYSIENKELHSSFFLLTMVFMLLMLVVQAAMWLAPVISLHNENVTSKEAIVYSLKAAFFNAPVLLIFAFLVIVFTLLALLPFGLGLLVWFPILNITTYHIYFSFFTNADKF